MTTQQPDILVGALSSTVSIGLDALKVRITEAIEQKGPELMRQSADSLKARVGAAVSWAEQHPLHAAVILAAVAGGIAILLRGTVVPADKAEAYIEDMVPPPVP